VAITTRLIATAAATHNVDFLSSKVVLLNEKLTLNDRQLLFVVNGK